MKRHGRYGALRPRWRWFIAAALFWTPAAIGLALLLEALSLASLMKTSGSSGVQREYMVAFENGAPVFGEMSMHSQMALRVKPFDTLYVTHSGPFITRLIPLPDLEGVTFPLGQPISRESAEALRAPLIAFLRALPDDESRRIGDALASPTRVRARWIWGGLFLNGSIPLLGGLLAASILFAFLWRRGSSRVRCGLCPHCAYDLRATEARVCPECGRERTG